MSENEQLVLTDKTRQPDDDYIFSIIGQKRALWQGIMQYLHDNHPDITGVWKYYTDGKSWLFRTVKKKKTVFWIGVLKDTFRITFYFGGKAGVLIENSDLSASVKDGFRDARQYGKIRPVSLKMQDKDDLETVLKLIPIKLRTL